MKKLKLIVSLLFMFALSVAFGLAVQPYTGINFYYTATGIVFLSLMPRPSGVLNVGVTPEIWQEFIAENLYKGMEFVKNAFNADQYVIGGSVVHIPQAGIGVSAKRNRTQLPAAIKRRKDIDVVYALDEYTTDPILITDAEMAELSYDKMQSVLGEKLQVLRAIMGDWMGYTWAAKKNIIRTSGDPLAAYLDNATGNRKAFTINDLRAIKKLMNKQSIPKEDRFALLSSEMLDQLENSLTAKDTRDFSRTYDAENGIIARLEGFNIIERADVVRYGNESTPVPKSPDDNWGTADNDASIFWQKNAVEKAEGTIKFFETLGDATMYGDVYSALVRLGGRIRREDEAGVVTVVQASA